MTTTLTSSSTPLRIGTVTLTVQDLSRVGDFYRQALGLERVDGSASVALLGTGNTVLLELVEDRTAPASSRAEAGLFHTAFLFPARADLGRWIDHVARNRIAVEGASDHRVSEAIYLSDPEGNGIEVYVDRPQPDWPYHDGALQMATDRLDTDSLRIAADETQWNGVPAGTVIGHVHLQVGALAEADGFYADALGFDITTRYPGARFYGSGGYHHHLAGNIWNSRHAAKRVGGSTGLRQVEILAADAATFESVAARAASGFDMKPGGGDLSLQDPWGTRFAVRRAPRS